MNSLRAFSRNTFLLLLGFLSMAAARSETDQHTEQLINEVISTAESYLGTRHQMGGNSRRGIDCSGLMVVSFQAAGITLPRTSSEQSRVGEKIRTSQLQRGDLVFFNISGRISHVGLVTKSNRSDTWFIHTSSSRGVMVSRLSETYWEEHVSHGRRVWSDPSIIRVRPGAPAIAAVPGSYPQASMRKLRRREIKAMNTREATLVQAEIWARNGYRFNDRELQRRFEQERWYQEMQTSQRRWKAKRQMSDVEKQNLRRLRRIADLEKMR